VKRIRLGAGLAFWGDTLRPALDMVDRGEIDYLCCDHLAELTMAILRKQQSTNPQRGYTRDILELLRNVVVDCHRQGIRIVSDAGGANPRGCAIAVADLCRELGLSGVKIGVVTGDDILPRIDELIEAGIDLSHMESGASIATVRQRLTQANVYIGSEGIVEALAGGADIVICGRVTDVALYLGPMIHELGWAWDDWHHLGIGAAVAHAAECGGQATGGLYSGGWQKMPDLENIGYPIVEVAADGSAFITKAPGTGGAVDVGTVSEQFVYEVLDPSTYLTADVTGDFSGITLEQIGPDKVAIGGVTGRRRPDLLKVNAGYRAGFIGEAQFTYTWPDAYAKSQRGLEFLERRLRMAGFEADATRVEYLGHNSMWGDVVGEPNDDELTEIVVRYAARCATAEQAAKVFTESVPLYNNGPAGLAGIGTRPPLKELYALWPCLIPRELVPQTVELVEV
jgi:hypothetical protein